MSIDLHGMALVAVVAAVTMLIRFLPFLAFGGGRPTPRFITYLAGVLPCAIMTMLVVYCLRGVDVDGPCGGYNLQWAWASALLAARAMHERLKA